LAAHHVLILHNATNLIKVIACGVCHSDSMFGTGVFGDMLYVADRNPATHFV